MTRTRFLRTPRGVVPICRACGKRLIVIEAWSRNRPDAGGRLVTRCGCDRAA